MPEALQLLSLIGYSAVCSGSFCLSFLQQPAHQLPSSCQLSLQACALLERAILSGMTWCKQHQDCRVHLIRMQFVMCGLPCWIWQVIQGLGAPA